MLYRKGGRNRDRNCRIPRISPPTFCTKAKVAKGGAYLRDTTVYRLKVTRFIENRPKEKELEAKINYLGTDTTTWSKSVLQCYRVIIFPVWHKLQSCEPKKHCAIPLPRH